MAVNLDFLLVADPIPYSDITSLNERAPNLIVYVLPVIFGAVILEFIYARWHNFKTHDLTEAFGSLLVGLINLMVSLVIKVSLFFGAVFIYNLVPWRMEFNWWTLIPCFILYDLCSYWSHRISHEVRILWATHVVHHSAESYNLTVAFRQSAVQHVKIIFFLPIAFLGFHPVIFFVANQLSTIYQFWVHTEMIGKIHPWVDKWFCTPSSHRVHHGSQKQYLDRNYGAVFMVWDHIFGSFEPEDEKPKFGLTTPLDAKLDPLKLNFHEFVDIYQDVKNSQSWKQKLFFIFASPAKVALYKEREKKPPLMNQ
ncbi:MAG: sterol desaturase family protein [Pedobacter sp.]|nr:MAG: sterol desaturase family protein [Pedobacter sp.]